MPRRPPRVENAPDMVEKWAAPWMNVPYRRPQTGGVINQAGPAIHSGDPRLGSISTTAAQLSAAGPRTDERGIPHRPHAYERRRLMSIL